MELIHSEDREEFKRQLTWNSMLPADKANLTLHEIMMPGKIHIYLSLFLRKLIKAVTFKYILGLDFHFVWLVKENNCFSFVKQLFRRQVWATEYLK